MVRSNVEAGEGFADIIIEPEDPDAGIILELKYSKEANGLEKACEKARRSCGARRTIRMSGLGMDTYVCKQVYQSEKRCNL